MKFPHLSPSSKRVRQKVMHRLTRGVNKGSVVEQTAWYTLKPMVHEAVTTALMEEEANESQHKPS